VANLVTWSDLSTDQVETLTAAWLVRVHPGAQRVDGSGGDGGVDVRLGLADGLHVFEIKSFRSRLAASQKRQIKNSLATALRTQSDMRKWTLVLPLDFTPAEIGWFENTLCRDVTIETDWIGLTALESGLSQHRDLLRAMAPGSVERRAMDLLADYNAESAAMARGAIEGVDRLQKLRDQLDLTDPDWAFDIAEVTPGRTVLALRPKNPDGPTRPITAGLQLQVVPGSELETAIDNFMVYGRPVDIPAGAIADVDLDLPGGLGQNLGPDVTYSARIGYPDAAAWQLRGRLVAIRDGKVIGTLPVDWNDSTRGPTGGQWLAGRDSSGFLEVLMQVDPTYRGGFTIKAPASEDVLPSEALPVLRFLQRLGQADSVELHTAGQDPVKTRVTGEGTGMPDTATLIAVAEALVRIQEATGTTFTLPRNWSRQDAEMLYFCDEILRSGSVTWSWPGAATPVRADEVAQVARLGPLPRININGQSAGAGKLPLMGHMIDLPGQVHMDIDGAVVTNLHQLVEHARTQPAWSRIWMNLAPDEQTTCRFYLVDAVETPSAHAT
jgi:hypothetical protein